MHPNPRRVLPVVLIVIIVGVSLWWYFGIRTAAANGALTASGTIEATQVNISPEIGGRVTAVNVVEGSVVEAGQALIQFDTTLLETQRQQAAAALSAAQANYDLLQAGPSEELSLIMAFPTGLP